MSHLLEQSILGEALHNAPVAAYVARDGEVVALNDAVCTLTGYTREEIVAGLVASIAADEESRRQGDEVVRVSYVVTRTHVARDALQFGLLWADGD